MIPKSGNRFSEKIMLQSDAELVALPGETPRLRREGLRETSMAMVRCLSAAAVERFATDPRGATAVEYALVASGVALAIAVTVMSLGTVVTGLYVRVAAVF
jgi:pilus assembly protein Flp/PilA